MTDNNAVREDSDFFSDGQRCAAWLYRPANSSVGNPPIIVMAHGFAGERTFRLPQYATKFANQGMAVLLFDYRHFGDSAGEPRNMVDHRRQHRDWLAALAHAKSIEGIDRERIALWGTSFSGGHVVSVAADHPHVRAIVSQAPMLHVLRSLRVDAKFIAAALWHAVHDYLRAMLRLSPHYIPIVASPGQFAALHQEGCEAGYRSMISSTDNHWENKCTARSLLSSACFRPSRKASSVHCQALFVLAQHDHVIRSSVSEKIARQVPLAEVVWYPVDHFDVYMGDVFEEISQRQADFLTRHLLVSSVGAATGS